MFYRARWGTGKPVCPFCGVVDAYTLKRRGRSISDNRFKCREATCGREFTLTTETMFWQHKLSFRDMLLVVGLAVNSVKSKSALQLSREMSITYKAAYVMLMKIREAIMQEQLDSVLDGIVEMDGANFSAKGRKANRRIDRVRRWYPQNRAPGRAQIVMVVRQREFEDLEDKVFTTVVPEEAMEFAHSIVGRKVSPDAVVLTDEHGAYRHLGDRNPHQAVNHYDGYADGPTMHTNNAESFFSRMRRAERGIHHHMGGKYLELYAAMVAWHETFRRKPFSEQLEYILKVTMNPKGFRKGRRNFSKFCGYWQSVYPVDAFEWQMEGGQ